MNDDGFRDWLRRYLQQHLGQWMKEVGDKIMTEQKIKNWPTRIEVELPCESCGEKINVPFRIKVFKCIEDVEWPYHMEYQSPAMKASTCPKCRNPFRLNLPTAERIQ